MQTTLEQRVRHAIVAHHARWSGRAPTTSEIIAAVDASRPEVERALWQLQKDGLVLARPDGWHTRPPRMTSRAGEAMALRSKVR